MNDVYEENFTRKTKTKIGKELLEYRRVKFVTLFQEGSSISRQNLNGNLETFHLAPMLFYHLPGFYLKTGLLNPHPLSLILISIYF